MEFFSANHLQTRGGPRQSIFLWMYIGPIKSWAVQYCFVVNVACMTGKKKFSTYLDCWNVAFVLSDGVLVLFRKDWWNWQCSQAGTYSSVLVHGHGYKLAARQVSDGRVEWCRLCVVVWIIRSSCDVKWHCTLIIQETKRARNRV